MSLSKAVACLASSGDLSDMLTVPHDDELALLLSCRMTGWATSVVPLCVILTDISSRERAYSVLLDGLCTSAIISHVHVMSAGATTLTSRTEESPFNHFSINTFRSLSLL